MNDLLNQVLKQSLTGSGDSAQLAAAIFGITVSMQAKRVLELGVRSGDTTLPLLVGCSYTDGTLVSVDSELHGFKCPEELKHRWTFRNIDAIEYLNLAIQDSEQFDLVFVDDSHKYEHVKEELNLIEKLITPMSIILLHDLMWGNSQPRYNESEGNGDCADGGPSRAVKEMDRDTETNSCWEYATIPRSNGLTLLRKLS